MKEHVACPICAIRGPGQCMQLCDGAGQVDLEDLARELAMEEWEEGYAESGGRLPPLTLSQKDLERWKAVARKYLSTLTWIYAPASDRPVHYKPQEPGPVLCARCGKEPGPGAIHDCGLVFCAPCMQAMEGTSDLSRDHGGIEP